MERYVNYYFFFSSRRRHTRWPRDWSSDVCSSDLDSDEIRPGAHHTLDGVATTLRDNSDLRVRIEGHTDSVGSAQYNEGLSQRRADSVRDFLSSRGIADHRMTTRGYGESRPVATNETDEGRAQNRRVEIVNWD